ncbi:MAG: DUF1822 family protein [Chlorogloeopsis fritschii C42_A2020_084]|uniref:DUF1822 family protein n=1 Tax=Chlorogloeopsis fritschii TaxID=1124 RepID=UPI0019DE3F28|nr:DUF1822 family protein [Chlorogloeopsis fritschii]MBF2005542.1 DUF1822 family protein [Chlorogloeopsis fritschii C42_A2020_084]
MKLNLQDLKAVYPDQIWQELSVKDLKHRESTINKYSNQFAESNADLNRLCLNNFITWVKKNLETVNFLKVLPTETDLSSIWDVVNGCAIAFNNTKIVLIPDEALDTEGMTVPQEWVDIPNWVVDYYLAVQLDVDAGWMSVWGYTSHRNLKEKGSYDSSDRTYSLERDYIITDLDMLWLVIEMGLDEKTTVNPLPSLTQNTAELLLEKLCQPSPYSPRLDLAFEQWAALLANDNWRRQLYLRRKEKTVNAPITPKAAVNLGLWLKHNFVESAQSGWQAIKTFFDLEPTQLAFALRSRSTSQLEKENVPPQGKLINLRMQRQEIAVVLLVAMTKEADDRIGVLIQVHPAQGNRHLPANLKLALLFDSTVVDGMSREQDVYVELPYFKCEPGTQFRVEVTLADTSFVEEFCIPLDTNNE